MQHKNSALDASPVELAAFQEVPDGFSADLDADQDRARGFHVTANGVTLITPEMLGQRIHRVS